MGPMVHAGMSRIRRLMVVAAAVGIAWAGASPMTAAAQPHVAPTKAKTATLRGTVTDAKGAPLRGVDIVLFDPGVTAAWPYDLPVVATTGKDGTYRVAGLKAGAHYQVCFDAARAHGKAKSGYQNQCRGLGWWQSYFRQAPRDAAAVKLAAGKTTTISARLAAGGSITGTVTDTAQQPLKNVQVRAWIASETGDFYPVSRGWVRTTAKGRYRLVGIPANTAVRVCFTGNEAARAKKPWNGGYGENCYRDTTPQGSDFGGAPIAVRNNATTAGISSILPKKSGISGTVTGANGKPAADIAVRVWPVDDYAGTAEYLGWGTWDTTTDAKGHYLFGGLTPGKYVVCFVAYPPGADPQLSQGPTRDEVCYPDQRGTAVTKPGKIAVPKSAAKKGVNARLVVS